MRELVTSGLSEWTRSSTCTTGDCIDSTGSSSATPRWVNRVVCVARRLAWTCGAQPWGFSARAEGSKQASTPAPTPGFSHRLDRRAGHLRLGTSRAGNGRADRSLVRAFCPFVRWSVTGTYFVTRSFSGHARDVRRTKNPVPIGTKESWLRTGGVQREGVIAAEAPSGGSARRTLRVRSSAGPRR